MDSANLRFTDFGDDAPEARRLYVAHKLTLYAKTVPPESFSDSSGSASSADSGGASSADSGSAVSQSWRASSWSALSSAGDGSRITSKKVDGVSVTYASGGSAGVSSSLADLTESVFGLQLLALLKLYSYPRYVP